MTAEKKYSIHFAESRKKNCLRLHYNGANRYLFVNSIEIHNFKAKDCEVNATPLCPRNISKGFSVFNMKKTGFHGYVFSINYDAIEVDDVLDIHK